MNSDQFSFVNGQDAYIYPRPSRVGDKDSVMHRGHIKDSTDSFELSAYASCWWRNLSDLFLLFLFKNKNYKQSNMNQKLIG